MPRLPRHPIQGVNARGLVEEGQRVKLATELQRVQRGGARCYILDQPTSGLHCADTNRLDAHLQTLVEAGHTVVEAELDIRVIAVANQVIDLGPGAGDAGGTMVATGTAERVADKGVAV